MDHIEISVFDYDKRKLCDIYSSQTNASGQAHDIVYTKEINGWKTLSFSLPYIVDGRKNFRWEYIKNENLIRYIENDCVEWFLINLPKKVRNKNGTSVSLTCDHISANLKTKGQYISFDDQNGIGTIEYLAEQVLVGTGWSLGQCDKFFESDGFTEKVRTQRTDGKLGAYQLIQNICDLFCAYPEFDGDKREIHLYSLNRRNAQLELTLEKNASSIEQTSDSTNIITRLYVEGEYSEDGYIGIDTVNPTGLPFLLNFDYYKSIGLFKQKHQDALDAYVRDLFLSRKTIEEITKNKNIVDNNLNTLWGQLDYLIFILNNGSVQRVIYGGEATSMDESFAAGDIVAIQHGDQTYTLKTVDENGVSFSGTDQYVIKYLTRAAGEIGAKEVAIESKEKMISKYKKELTKEHISDLRRQELLELISKEEASIQDIYLGVNNAEGLYSKVFQAVEKAIRSFELQSDYSSALSEQDYIEATFVLAMGDMLKDGYWCNSNYVVGQELNLYKDALAVMEDLSKPAMGYAVSVLFLKNIFGVIDESFDLNTSLRIYDEHLGVNDFVYVSKVIHHVDAPDKDSIEISNEYLSTQRKTFESVLTRITQLVDILNVKKSLYDRADSINANGSIPAQRLEGKIDVLKAQLSSAVSNWYTDENGNIVFVSVDGQSAMQLCGEGFMIANGRLDDGSWNWRTKYLWFSPQ